MPLHPINYERAVLVRELDVHAMARIRPGLPLCSANVARVRLDADGPALVVFTVHDESRVGDGFETADEGPVFEVADDGKLGRTVPETVLVGDWSRRMRGEK